MTDRKIIYEHEDIQKALQTMASDILLRHQQEPMLIGIRRGGVTISERLSFFLAQKLGRTPQSGIIDINLYRDDWTRARALPKVGRTEIPMPLDNRRVILIDDVLYTGRTVRAALEALTEFGRSSRIELAILVDRGHREMPIQADYVPFVISTRAEEMVEVDFNHNGRDQIILIPAAGTTLEQN